MTALLGLLGPASEDNYDCYGVVSAAALAVIDTTAPDPTQVGMRHLMIALKGGLPSIDVDEISFDSSNIVSKHLVYGHPGVVGLLLSTSTVSSTFADPVFLTDLDFTNYILPSP